MKTDYEELCEFFRGLDHKTEAESDSVFYFSGNFAMARASAEAFVRGEGYQPATQKALMLIGEGGKAWMACVQGRGTQKVDTGGEGRVRFRAGQYRLCRGRSYKYYPIDADGRLEGDTFDAHFFVRSTNPDHSGCLVSDGARQARAAALGGKPGVYTITVTSVPWGE